MSEYWTIVAEAAFEDAKIPTADITRDQWNVFARTLERGAEMEGESTGRSSIPNPDHARIATLEKSLQREREKVACKTCGGDGRLQYSAGVWAVNTQCDTCRGEGKHDPR